jgi:ribosome-associated protein
MLNGVFIVCTGTSNIHVAAISNSVRRHVSKKLKEKPFSIEGVENQEWVLIDYVDVVVHVFQKEIREYYDLENLWGDAKITNVELKA